jgi:hypothetical protein
MNDMTATIIPKSDQINADDLLAGPRTITVTKVVIDKGKEQPVDVFFEGDGGKPFRPSKSMRRVMVAVWGDEPSNYVGKSMTLYRDPDVKWGGMAVGGIRISNMSHMDSDLVIALTETKKVKKPFRVRPLVVDQPKPPVDPAIAVAAELVAFADGIEDAEALAAFEANESATKRRNRLKAARPELSRDVEAAVMAAQARVKPAPAVTDDDVPF